MKRINKLLTLGFALLFAATSMQAGDLDRIGTTSGSQLLIPVGARSIALGGAPLATINGAEAIYWNPAGIAGGTNSEFMFNNMQYIANIDVNYLAAVFNGGNIGSFGFHISSMDFGDIERTTEDSPDGTGDFWSPTFVVAGFSYSRLLTDRIQAGITGKYVYESIIDASAGAFAIDMGVQYNFGKNLQLGVTMKNVGTKMRYSGTSLEQTFLVNSPNPDRDDGFFSSVAIESDIPSLFGFGMSYNVNVNEENSFVLSGAFSNYNDASDRIFSGVEYNFREMFYLRGGYNYEAQVDAADQLFGATFGAGVNWSLGTFGFAADYAYQQVNDYFDSGNIFTVKLTY